MFVAQGANTKYTQIQHSHIHPTHILHSYKPLTRSKKVHLQTKSMIKQ